MVEVLIGLVITAVILIWILLRKNNSKIEDQSILLIQEQLSKVVETLDKKLGESNESMRSQIGESNKLIKDITQQLTKVNETNKQVIDVTNQLKTIQNILMNPKQRRRTWGVFSGNGLKKCFTSRALFLAVQIQ